MVSVISIGIEQYGGLEAGGLGNISCAYTDAEHVYDAFENVLGSEMRKYSSACLKNLTVSELRSLLSAIQLSIKSEDIFILYFSGHGVTGSNGRLKLVFADYCYSEEKSMVSITEVLAILSSFHCRIILILDCCYSGASLAESGADDVCLENSISILASNRPITRAKYDNQGSEFTVQLCRALRMLQECQCDITLNNIYGKIKEEYQECQIISGGGCSDIIIKKEEHFEIREDFIEKFINKVISSNYEMREALWYALGEAPEPLRVAVLTRYKDVHSVIPEMSWRVRRAIGSICATNVTHKGRELINSFLNSDIWMEKCIGYISVHREKSEIITQSMLRELENINHPMDLKWLIALYLSERNWEGKERILDSGLLKNSWCAIEIWKRYFNEYPLEQRMGMFWERMEPTDYKRFCLELYFRREYEKIDWSDYPEEVYVWKEVIQSFYDCKPRGQFNGLQINKWIASTLYGNWRDQVNLGKALEICLKGMRSGEKKSFVQVLKYIPSVEIKMAVLDFFAMEMKRTGSCEYEEELVWALEDEHPWVLRTALPLYAGKREIVKNRIRKNINMMEYPGVFDLAIELSRQKLDGVGYEITDMTDIEKMHLNIAVRNEQN